jgi:hypothetical protein
MVATHLFISHYIFSTLFRTRALIYQYETYSISPCTGDLMKQASRQIGDPYQYISREQQYD